VQAAYSAVNNPSKDTSKALPLDTPEEGSALTKVIVSTIVQVALKAGFTEQEISTAINKSGNVCVETAKRIDSVIQNPAAGGEVNLVADSVAGQVASQVAAQVASQVAAQVAKEVAVQVAAAVAAEVKNHVDTRIQLNAKDWESVTDPLSTPGVGTQDTIPTAPGKQFIPGVNVPPQNLSPLPTPTPTPVPTPTPTPVPTPTPPSPL
jgi:hypothetical protein